jgi:hypothetical protein
MFSSYSYMPEIPSAAGRLYRNIENQGSSNSTETDHSQYFSTYFEAEIKQMRILTSVPSDSAYEMCLN